MHARRSQPRARAAAADDRSTGPRGGDLRRAAPGRPGRPVVAAPRRPRPGRVRRSPPGRDRAGALPRAVADAHDRPLGA
ncbi:MAG: hypothetical protein EDQ89_09785 [Acidobacteria bacterium]|nr:MAG: hypothetical protein EDQ89_09785 [Acidobacteriota bacterium]